MSRGGKEKSGDPALELVQLFAESAANMSPREVAKASGINHMGVREILEDAENGEVTRVRMPATLRKMEDFVRARQQASARRSLTVEEKAARYDLIEGIVGLGVADGLIDGASGLGEAELAARERRRVRAERGFIPSPRPRSRRAE